MSGYDYLIVGGGMAARAAIDELKNQDPEGSIGLITAEQTPPYDRPPLSKQLWTGRKRIDEIYHPVPSGVDVYPGRRAEKLDRDEKFILDDRGRRTAYGKLLLATGSSPRRLPFGEGRIVYFRTVEDYLHLKEVSETHARIAVIGGGFIGSEMAAALAMNGCDVTLVFPEDGIGARQFPAGLSRFLNDTYRDHGVEVLPGASAVDVTGSGTDLTLHLEDGRTIGAHAIVAGIGVTPNVGLAESAGLAVGDGIRVNARLQTSDPEIYAAGDVANFMDALLGIRRRVEHEDAALSMGRAAARNMAGGRADYDHSPMFYSDLFDLGYEAVGRLDARLEMVERWQEPNRKGTVYYLDGDRVCGVLLWDLWGKVDAARKLIASGEPVVRSDLPEALPG